MSKYDIRTSTGRQLSVEYNLGKIFISDHRSYDGAYTNSGYADEEFLAGTPVGKVSATGKLKKWTSGAVDGSQNPCGLIMENCVITAGSTETLTYCIAGDVAQDKVLFQGSDALTTLVSGRTFAELLMTNTGIILVPTTDNTKSDNY